MAKTIIEYELQEEIIWILNNWEMSLEKLMKPQDIFYKKCLLSDCLVKQSPCNVLLSNFWKKLWTHTNTQTNQCNALEVFIESIHIVELIAYFYQKLGKWNLNIFNNFCAFLI